MLAKLFKKFALLLRGLYPPRFAEEIEKVYQNRLNERSLAGVRFVMAITPFIFLSFIVWDYAIFPESFHHAISVRLGFGVAFALLWLASFFDPFRTNLAFSIAILVLLASVSITWVLNVLPNGLLYGTAGYSFLLIGSTILPNARLLAGIGLIPFFFINFWAILHPIDPKTLLNANFMLVFQSFLAYIVAISNEIRDRQLFLVETELEAKATTDSLSGALNHRFFIERTESELAGARRYSQDVCLLLLDIDHFKRVNDTYGHAVGDQVISLVAQTCNSVLRSTDLLGRVGGEEFAILLPKTNLEDAKIVAERIRHMVSDLSIPIEHLEQPTFTLTISIGITKMDIKDDVTKLMKHADVALYQAKGQGRNRVVVYEPNSAV